MKAKCGCDLGCIAFGPKIRKYELPLSSRSSRDETWTNLDVLDLPPSFRTLCVHGVGRCGPSLAR